MIEVKDLVKYYGKSPAVDHISFTLEPGKVYGFLGPNGAGKSTTMNIMTGYLAATSGDVIINGNDIVSDPEEVKKNIGYLPEQPPLYMDMTVEEYLTFVANLKKVKRAERHKEVVWAMESTGLTEYRRRLISNLSKGYKQRVGLAQAIIGNPEIIILDEPTVGLDPRQIIEIRELIKKLSVSHTVILSSHIMSEISAVCDQIMIIVRGHLIANETPEALVEKYAKDAHLLLTVRGPLDQVREALSGVKGIQSLSVTPDHEEAMVHVDMVEENGVDAREAVYQCLKETDLTLLEMRRNVPTLEDVFIRLTNEEEQRFIENRERQEMERMKRKSPEKKPETTTPEKTEDTEKEGGDQT